MTDSESVETADVAVLDAEDAVDRQTGQGFGVPSKEKGALPNPYGLAEEDVNLENVGIDGKPAIKDGEAAPDVVELECSYSYLILTASAAGNFLLYGIQQSFGIFISYYIAVTFAGTSVTQVALTSSLQGGFSFLLGPVAGRMTDRVGPRWTALLGVTLQVISHIAASFSLGSIVAIQMTQGVIFGMGGSFTSNACISAPAGWFTRRLSMAFGIAVAAGGLGGVCFTFGTQAMLLNLGPAWTLRIYAIVNAVLLYPAALALKTNPRAPVLYDSTVKRPFINFKLFTNVKFSLTFVGLFLCALAFPAPFYLPSYVYDVGLDPTLGAPLLATCVGVSGAAAILAGSIAPHTGILNLFVGSQLCAAISVLVFWLPAGTNVAMLFVFAAVWGLCWGPVWNLVSNVTATLFSHLDSFPVVIGTIYLAFSLAFFANAPIFGSLVDAGAIYNSDGVRIGADYKYAQIWVGAVYLTGGMVLFVVRMMEANWKIAIKV